MAVMVQHRGSDGLPLADLRWGDRVATFAPSRGGRLLALSIEQRQLLWVNPQLVDASLHPVVPLDRWPTGASGMVDWANLGGSKTWPAPQGWESSDEWPGPPDAVLDQGPWHLGITRSGQDVTVSLESGFDAFTGLVVRKRFEFIDGSDSFIETIELFNGADREIRWSPWEVCQVATDAPSHHASTVRVTGVGRGGMKDLGTWEGAVETRPDGDDLLLSTGTGVGKRGFHSPDGHLEYRGADGYGLRLGLIDLPVGAVFPDGGSSLEVWLQRPVAEPIIALGGLRPDAHLVELEVLGPLSRLDPGAHVSSRVRWELLRPAQ